MTHAMGFCNFICYLFSFSRNGCCLFLFISFLILSSFFFLFQCEKIKIQFKVIKALMKWICFFSENDCVFLWKMYGSINDLEFVFLKKKLKIIVEIENPRDFIAQNVDQKVLMDLYKLFNITLVYSYEIISKLKPKSFPQIQIEQII